MKKMAEVIGSIGTSYETHTTQLLDNVETLQQLSANSLRVMTTRSDYLQSLTQHSIKKRNFERLKFDLGNNSSNSPYDMQRLAKAEDDVYAAERYMKASHEDIMNQLRWVRREASKKYSNTFRQMCSSFRELFESGLEKIREIEDLLPLLDETDIEEPVEKRKELEVIRRNMLSLAHPSSNAPQLVQDCKLFGVHLEEVMSRPGETEDIPIVVNEMIEYIEEHLDTEGIFRIPASTLKLNEYIERANLGMPLNLEDEHNPHNVCGLLKKYLRVLPDSLLTNHLYSGFVSLMEINEDQRGYMVEALFSELPPSHRKLLIRLLELMRNVIDHSANNKMNQSNILVVMAPNLHYVHDENPLAVAQRTPQIVFITRTLYENLDRLKDIEEDLSSEIPKEHSETRRSLPLPPVPKISKNTETNSSYSQNSPLSNSHSDRSFTHEEVEEAINIHPQEDEQDVVVDTSFDSSLSRSRRSGFRFRDFNFDHEQLRASFETAERDLLQGSFENLSLKSYPSYEHHDDGVYITEELSTSVSPHSPHSPHSPQSPQSIQSSKSHQSQGSPKTSKPSSQDQNKYETHKEPEEICEVEDANATPNLSSVHRAMEEDEVVVESPFYVSVQDLDCIQDFQTDSDSDTPTLEECTPLHCDSTVDFSEATTYGNEFHVELVPRH